MKNPFVFGHVVGGDDFCNRRREQRELARAIENGERLFIYSERRIGKTSLVKVVLDRLPSSHVSVFVDLWPTQDPNDLVFCLAAAISQSLATNPEKILETAMRWFSALSPTLTIDTDGRARVAFGVNKIGPGMPNLAEVLEVPQRVAAEGDRRVVVVLDEFQRIFEFDDDTIERQLRASMQNQPDVSYLFLGSRKHLINAMISDRTRPLYGAGSLFPIGTISDEHWLPFMRTRFASAGIRIADDVMQRIVQLTDGHPFYTQRLCHALWELALDDRAVGRELIDDALNLLLHRESYAYSTIADSLTHNQRRLLVALAHEAESISPYSREFIDRYGMKSASTTQRAIEALMKRDLIDKKDNSYSLTDRFLRLWLLKTDRPRV